MEVKNKKTNYLTRLHEFEVILADYKPSQASIGILAKTPLVLLVGPTAAGRNTLINILVQTGRYHNMVSDTTRQPRANNGIMEENGKEYWFRTEEKFLEGLRQGDYIEASVIHEQQVSGANSRILYQSFESGKIALQEVEVHGAGVYHHYNPKALVVFLLPPTFDVWMERLRARGHMPEAEIRRRLQSAQEEIAAALREDYYQFVINNEIHEAAMAVDELANGRVPDAEKQAHGRSHAEQLAIDVRLYLGK